MYLICLILCIVILLRAAIKDKKISYAENDFNTIWHIEYQDNDTTIGYYLGRRKIYKILIILSLIPYINALLLTFFLLIFISKLYDNIVNKLL